MATTLTLAGLILLGSCAYAVGCLIWPYGSCRRCAGTGKLRSPFGGDAARFCPRCKHTGLRLRAGRRLWAGWRPLRQDIHQ